LARPALVGRLFHSSFNQDERLAGQTFTAWWQESKNNFTFDLNQPAGSYYLPTINVNLNQDNTWQSTAAIPGQTLGQGVWTGAEMLFLGNRATQGFRYDPTTDTWDTMTTVGAPLGVNDFTAIWTGTEMITWGGCNGTHEFCTTSMGGRYNPATDTWLLTNTANSPNPRRKHGAVWTGSEMIVWGGCTESSSGNQNCSIVLNDGGRYNPATNSWQAMTMTNAPSPRTFPPLVWTDDEMILWSGSAASNPGGRYNPTTNSWQSISAINGPAGNGSTLVWTGSEVIAWGGCTGMPFCTTYYNSGGRYNPNTDSWTPTNTTGAPSARSDHKAVWTGSEMLVWGGYNGSSYPAAGGRYNPTTNSWTAISTTNAPAGRGQHQAFWTGSLLLVWGGFGANGSARDGARYDPASNSWTPTDATDPYSFREHHTAIWTGTEMIAWGGYGDGTAATGLDTGRIYDPITDSWDETSVTNAPSPRAGHSAIWTGTEIIVWGGNTVSWSTPGDGGRYNPMTDSWADTSMASAPEAPSYHSAVWTGTEMIVFGGSIWDSPWDNGGGRYNPSTNSWSPISMTGVPQGRYLHTAVWTGSEMLVWGGAGSTGSLGDGARYSPTSNSWTTISNTNDPSARVLHSAIWDGSRMIIWGGSEDYSPWINTNTGGLYNPSTNSWTATSTVMRRPPAPNTPPSGPATK
jgi:N-acetylneuraminic acid mutarotase